MGVIKKNNPKLGKFSSDSEESLNVAHPSEDENIGSVSDVSSVGNQVATPSRVRHFLPIPIPGASARNNQGKKRFRIYENRRYLETLIEEEELQAITIYDFVVTKCRGFSNVLENEHAKEKWENFIANSEDEQLQIIQRREVIKPSFALPLTPEDAFRNIKTGLRNILKKSQIPLSMLQYLEMNLVKFFVNSPADIFISERFSSFERLLLHGIAQYYSLRSFSFDSERESVRFIKILNPHKDFHQPSMLLGQFLLEHRTGHASGTQPLKECKFC